MFNSMMRVMMEIWRVVNSHIYLSSSIDGKLATEQFLNALSSVVKSYFQSSTLNIFFYKVYNLVEIFVNLLHKERHLIEATTTGIFPFHLILEYVNGKTSYERQNNFQVSFEIHCHISHQRHPLHLFYWTNMRNIYDMYGGNWKCDGCGITYTFYGETMFAHHCFLRRIDLCGDCFRVRKFRKFPIHRHSLIPVDAATIYNNAPGWWACNCCQRQGGGNEINS